MAPPRKKRLVVLVDVGAGDTNQSRRASVVAERPSPTFGVQKSDETCVAFVGSRATRNRLYDEENDDEDDDDDEENEGEGKYYANVEVLGELKVQSIEYAKEVEDKAREFDDDDEKTYEYKGDILDALTIACDILAQRMEMMQGNGKDCERDFTVVAVRKMR